MYSGVFFGNCSLVYVYILLNMDYIEMNPYGQQWLQANVFGVWFLEDDMKSYKLLTVQEVADQLGLGKTRTYDLILQGAIGSIKIGRSRRVHPKAIEEFIERQVKGSSGRGGPANLHRGISGIAA